MWVVPDMNAYRFFPQEDTVRERTKTIRTTAIPTLQNPIFNLISYPFANPLLKENNAK